MQPDTMDNNIPAFLNKLWKMVNDPATDHLICWAKDGKSFIIQNEAGVWYDLLPAYYKHNNMSSFIRQLNMYGFHKVSNTDSNYTDHDRAEYQFKHSFFQKGHYGMLKNIKRKVATTKFDKKPVQIESKPEMNRILNDVKQLHGRQAQIDTILSSLKQENAVLWRELALLRQKHQKQQQIVNKLIQFLVTIVQPATRMGGGGGIGVKRRYPLMLNENPQTRKKAKDGPTIHELDTGDVHHLELPSEELVEKQVESPCSTTSNPSNRSKSPASLLNEACDIMDSPPVADADKSDYVNVEDLLKVEEASCELPDELEVVDDPITEHVSLQSPEERVFMTPSSQDTMLSNLLNGSYNVGALSSGNGGGGKQSDATKKDDENASTMALATRDQALNFTRLNSVDEMDAHLENTQSELDQLKEFLNGCNSIDTSCLMNLFNENPSFGISLGQNSEQLPENDSLVSGSELTPYDTSGFVDFTKLFDESSNPELFQTTDEEAVPDLDNLESVINTPDINLNEPPPTFPQKN